MTFDLCVLKDKRVAVGAGGGEDGGHIIAAGQIGFHFADGGLDALLDGGIVVGRYVVHDVLIDDGLHFFYGDKHQYFQFVRRPTT